ncbi:MAG: ABC transporter permease [Myxococcales bacterium]|nr:ABC transporter permease [Myxococcales bacterium]
MREMRQAQRVARTPWVLLGLTLALSFCLCALGAMAASAERADPAKVGSTLFQVFFSVSYAVVAIVGPAVAANGIAAEREGRTWEAVLLAGLDAPKLARGKFLAAYTTLSLYVVTLAPVGALCFLFGGVTALELLLAFGLLFAFAALAVWCGLAVSSLMTHLRGALVATLALAAAVGPGLYLVFGLAAGRLAHDRWSEIDGDSPVWLPLALARADFSVDYLVWLVLVPAAALLGTASFLHGVTVANLKEESDDRSTGLKRWTLFSAPVVIGIAAALTALSERHRGDTAVVATCGAFAYLSFLTLLFLREPLGPSRRVRVRWDREGASALTRWLGPGITSSARLVQLATLAVSGTVAATACASLNDLSRARGSVLALAVGGAAFLFFLIGLGQALRARGLAVGVTRAVVVAAALVATMAPWFVVLVAAGGGDKAPLMPLASPSPFYAFYMGDQVDLSSATRMRAIGCGLCADVAWALLGLALSAYAARRARALCRRGTGGGDLTPRDERARRDL